MKKIAILAMSLLIAGAVFAQTPQAPAKKEAAKTEKKCCDKKDKKECTEGKKECKKACAEKKAEKKACCAEKKAEKKS
ncbi:hypothetical protein [uncultured Acetobacteroides sp.]|uniref:hypothetical protein n=1 Tax=uncultured Acetobacteroides sp. TaxID=1760811 RepID=UPI0029F55C57|nr:hypothetical protein [uncultured Acetobacteroides sp.]